MATVAAVDMAAAVAIVVTNRPLFGKTKTKLKATRRSYERLVASFLALEAMLQGLYYLETFLRIKIFQLLCYRREESSAQGTIYDTVIV